MTVEWTYDENYTFRVVDSFEEPMTSNLMREIFFEGFPSVDPKKFLTDQERQNEADLRSKIKDRYHLRIAVHCRDEFVGWTCGWQDTDNRFYMATSAVLPEHRNKGIYTQLVSAVLRITKEEGFQSVHSNHLAANNNVIIPKLKLGFVITGMEMLEFAGMMVKTAFYHHPIRRDLYLYRVGMQQPSAVIRNLLGYDDL